MGTKTSFYLFNSCHSAMVISHDAPPPFKLNINDVTSQKVYGVKHRGYIFLFRVPEKKQLF